jgi:uncharacterized protein YbjQ (UPF0145 family)
MLIATMDEIPGHRVVEFKGHVFGVVVRSRGLGGNLMAGCGPLAAARSPSTHISSRRLASTRWTA